MKWGWEHAERALGSGGRSWRKGKGNKGTHDQDAVFIVKLTKNKCVGVVAHICNPNTGEAEVRGLL